MSNSYRGASRTQHVIFTLAEQPRGSLYQRQSMPELGIVTVCANNRHTEFRFRQRPTAAHSTTRRCCTLRRKSESPSPASNHPYRVGELSLTAESSGRKDRSDVEEYLNSLGQNGTEIANVDFR